MTDAGASALTQDIAKVRPQMESATVVHDSDVWPNVLNGAPESDGDTWPDRILRCVTLTTVVAGFATPASWNHAPVAVILDVTVVVIILAELVRRRPARQHPVVAATWGLAASCYVGIKVTAWQLGGTQAALADFVQAYKAYLFLIPLTWFIGKGSFTGAGLARTVRPLLFLTLAKYVVSYPLMSYRPAIWTENNFELMTVIGLTALAWPWLGKRRMGWIIVLSVIVILSASRCSILELVVVLLALYWRPNDRRFFVYSVLIATLGCVGTRVISARVHAGGGMAGLDRIKFWEVFLSESSRYSGRDWIFGTPPLTHLSYTSCDRLSYYRGLFSHSGAGDVCYSVVVHMFALRAVMDQGVFGVTFLILFLWMALRRSGASLRDRVAIIGIGVANSLSVSGFNSEYMLIPLVVAMGLRRSRRVQPDVS